MSKKLFTPRPGWLPLCTAACRFGRDRRVQLDTSPTRIDDTVDWRTARPKQQRRHGDIVYADTPVRQLMARLREGQLRYHGEQLKRELGPEQYQQSELGRKAILREIKRDFPVVLASGKIRLYGKAAPDAPFRPIALDVWSCLRKIDWIDGTAIAEDGARFLCIHAAVNVGTKRGRKPKLDLTNGIAELVFEKLEILPPGRGVQAEIERFILSEFEMSESTARDYASRLISDYRRRKAGN